MAKKSDREVTLPVEKKKRKSVVAMVPIFSWKTILAVGLGLILGVGLGLGYWIMSPKLSSSSLTIPGTGSGSGGGGFAEYLGTPHTGLYECVVNVQVVSPGSSYMSLKDLQNRGEYYSAKANSLPFFEFLSQELAKQAPEYSHAAEELGQILKIKYDWNSALPAIEVKATGSSAQEASFLAGFVPQSFKSYLIAEENEEKREEQQNTMESIANVKAAIIETEGELSVFVPQESDSQISNDPTYLALNAKIESLEAELDRQALELAFKIATGDVTEIINRQQQEYEATLQKARDMSIALTKAKQQLRAIEEQWADSHDISNTADYIEIKAKIRALEFQLSLEMTELAVLIAEDTPYGNQRNVLKSVERTSKAIAEAKEELASMEEQAGDDSLTEDLEYQLAKAKVDTLNMELAALQERLVLLDSEIVGQQTQQDAQAAFERTSAALAEARKELALLESLESQAGDDGLTGNVEYQLAQAKADTLNNELAGLTEKLSLLLADNVGSSEITDCLVAGNPSIPLPVLPERIRARNALMMGAIIGVGGAWVLLNFRWIAKGMPSSSAAKPSEDEEEEA